MAQDREQEIRKLAHRIWEEEGRPEGRAEEHWRAAKQRLAAAGASGAPVSDPDEAQTSSGASRGVPADPLRNPMPNVPAEDPMYPAITGPEEVSPIPGATEGLNPWEIVEPKRAKRSPPRASEKPAKPASGTRRTGGGAAEVKLRRRPGNTSSDA